MNYYNKQSIKKPVIIVEKSTVPIGTYKMILGIIDATSVKENRGKYTVASNPEFLA